MSEAERPNPDEILARLKREETAASRGKLKIFFGMSPGVGKTYAMLQAARQKQAQGCEVVIGVVETHGRKETEALTEGMPIMPRSQLEYRGTTLNEMDLDAILTWHPGLAVVDELAHTNAPGSRHPKRYQDVLELLDAGIDVYTTLNVQHVASRSDTVRQISGVSVHETVPDSVLDLADEIALVDLTPEQLRLRLAEGKVYLGEKADWAAKNFFRESNLTALREMALRLVAEHVDRDLRDIMSEEKIVGPWKSGDRLLVAVSASPYSERLIRYTRRLAASMEASWIVANIERSRGLSEEEQTRLNRYLALARQLGAEVISTPGTDVGEALLRIAQQHNVTQIVIGKPLGTRWLSFWRRDPLRWLMRHSGNIDIHMIPADESAQPRREPIEERLARAPWRDFGIALTIAAVVTAISLAIFDYTGYWAVALFYLLAVVLAATRLRRWPTLFLAALSAVLWDFLFIPPRFTFYISQLQDFLMFGAYFVIAIVIGHLASQLREREQSERRREERATALYRLTRSLAASRDLDEALPKVLALIKSSFLADAAVWLRDESGLSLHSASLFTPSSKDESVAMWAFQKKQAAGKSTDTLPDAESLHIPLVTGDRSEGVLMVRLASSPTIEQRELLDAFAAQLALFVNKERALEESREAQIARQSQKLQKTLFDSVSHELKTPLAAMTAALQQPEPDCSELQQAARRLTRTVDHLLDATRLESGLLQPVREWCDPAELVREAIGASGLKDAEVRINIAKNLPAISVDSRLIQQALGSLLSNAVAHGKSEQPIEVSAARDDSMLVISVADHGPGLASGEENKVFEKFYRGPRTRPGGLGLGLSIARQLVEAHGGQIVAQNQENGGARFSIRLPIGEAMRLPTEAATA
ncbi:MAG TPA: sensor histidine kinase KdpD [Chthoniobacterales bacterium]|jgi:two-component system sensor histidine kinase KdpD|nr:sensor histidine kinase KdpD [Chthoniobacterales bacterium]